MNGERSERSERATILIGFKYLASAVPILTFAGVAIGVGCAYGSLLISISRNPSVSDNLIRWSFISFSLIEVSGFIGLIYAFLLLYAFQICFYIYVLNNVLFSLSECSGA